MTCINPDNLTPDDWNLLERRGWGHWAAHARAIWVSIERQRLYLIEGRHLLRLFNCSTAQRGVGQREGSNQTPLGWHTVKDKIGDGLEPGAILRSRRWVGDVWRFGDAVEGDLILSRILWLSGLEPGHNLGGAVDTYSRYIYIHGTHEINRLGRPASHGCIRIDPCQVIELFDLIAVGTRVLIG